MQCSSLTEDCGGGVVKQWHMAVRISRIRDFTVPHGSDPITHGGTRKLMKKKQTWHWVLKTERNPFMNVNLIWDSAKLFESSHQIHFMLQLTQIFNCITNVKIYLKQVNVYFYLLSVLLKTFFLHCKLNFAIVSLLFQYSI